MKASIVIANYNNSNFIEECINSLKSQTYKNIEIIFFDDNSKDNSINVIKKFSNIKILQNKTQTKYGSLNQINAFKKSIEISTGDIIFFLDSDDYFKENKIEKIINFFLENNEKKIVFDFPTIFKKNKKINIKKKNKFFNSYWGYIHPTSCISIRKEFITELFDNIINEKFTDIWLDLRVLLFSKYIDEYNIIEENLTFYRQYEGNVSSRFKKFNKFWWKRRSEAHDYFFYFMKLNNLYVRKNLDFYVTKFVNKFLNF
ncbi:glycosyltransferase family 2 protein [Candidatus Pelagibacter sp.]|jgi:glycosyltransferase involved in cell wall biosynthesis|nr:glycosyltransferase family 2 protein [Candidatus Pelagibacter sp.]